MKIAVFFMGWAVCTAIDIPAEDPAVWRFFAELVPLASMILFTTVFILIEKRMSGSRSQRMPEKERWSGRLLELSG